MSAIQEILSGIGVYWSSEKNKINANFTALNDDKAENAAIPTNTSDLTNNSNFVVDSGYVHTDNNFTDGQIDAIALNTLKRSYPDADETRLADTSGTNTGDQDLSAYITSLDVDAALDNKVDKDGAKVLTDVNFTSGDKVLVDTISDKQPKQSGYGLSQNNYSPGDADKMANVPINTNSSLAGKADLVSGLVPLDQLPEETKNSGVIQYDELADFPGTGDDNIIYLAKDTNIMYRWNGATYIVVATSDIDIASLDEINDTLTNTDLLIVNDASTGDNKNLLLSRVSDYIQEKLAALTTLAGWSSVLDEDNMASNDDTKLATQQSIKAYVDGSSSSWDGDITDIDIVGGADVGAAIEDTDLVLISDGAAVKKSAVLRIWDYIQTKLANTDIISINKARLQSHSIALNTLSSSSNALTIDLDDGNLFEIYLSEDITSITIANPPSSGSGILFYLIVHQDYSSTYTITWPSDIIWPGGTAPTLSTTSDNIDAFSFLSVDETTNWIGTTYGADYPYTAAGG